MPATEHTGRRSGPPHSARVLLLIVAADSGPPHRSLGSAPGSRPVSRPPPSTPPWHRAGTARCGRRRAASQEGRWAAAAEACSSQRLGMLWHTSTGSNEAWLPVSCSFARSRLSGSSASCSVLPTAASTGVTTHLERQLQQPELLVAAGACCRHIQPWLGEVHLAHGRVWYKAAMTSAERERFSRRGGRVDWQGRAAGGGGGGGGGWLCSHAWLAQPKKNEAHHPEYKLNAACHSKSTAGAHAGGCLPLRLCCRCAHGCCSALAFGLAHRHHC